MALAATNRAVGRTASRRLAAVVMACLTMTSTALAQIQWRSGASEPSGQSKADVVDTIASVGQRGADRHLVVQFDEPVTPDQRAKLAAAGVDLLTYVGDNAFFAAVAPGAVDTQSLADLRSLKDAQVITRAWKLEPRILDGDVPDHAVVREDTLGDRVVGVYVVFHADTSLAEDATAAVLRHAGEVRDQLESIHGLVVELPESNIPALADEASVQWIEFPLPRMGVVNNSNRVITEANAVQAAPYNLDGSGVTVLVYDGGTARGTHNDFGGRLTVRDSSGMADHATHVAGTIGGSGVSSGGTYKGMAPAVTLESYGFEYDGSGTFLYTNPGDIESDYDQAINTYGADISNNSIGSNVEPNGFDCSYQGNYGATAATIDAIVRGSLGEPFRVVWAAGNERQGSSCNIEGHGDYYSTAPPGGAKNQISVGALNSNDDSMTSFSSWGPVDDGRLKPDVSAPGCQGNDDNAVTSCSSSGDSAYTTKCGTSMASPTVCGLAALLIEDFRAQFPALPLFRNSTLKAWLAHTAQDRGNTGPDYQFGYGSVRVQQAIDLMRTGAFVEASVEQNGSYSRVVTVFGSVPELKVTLAWDDVPGTLNVLPALVNDLDLRVYDPSGQRYYPWTLDPANPAASAVQTQEDHLNNIEQVRVLNPAAGTWTIEVYGHSVPSGPQTFSLVGDGTTDVGLSISFAGDLPEAITPGSAEVIDVEIEAVGQTLVPGSPSLHYRYDGGTYLTAPLTFVSGDLYRATLPPADCADVVEYYLSAQGSTTGLAYQPGGAPAETLTADVGEWVSVFADNFQTNQGWTVANASLTDGAWDRGVPVDCDRGDPPSDFDGSGQCYLTDNDAGDSCNSDVDGGTTSLISPTIDLSAGDARVHYALWYTNDVGADPNNDYFVVRVSNNNGSNWTEVETFGPQSAFGWTEHTFIVGDYVTPTAQVKVRFEVSDLSDGSVVEAGLDDFTVTQFGCEDAGCSGDQDCEDGLTCTVDTCNLQTHECEFPVAANTCLIGSICYDDDDLNPANDCEACISSSDPNDWSPRTSGSACGDPSDTDCDDPDTCNGAGACLGNLEPDTTECRPSAGDCDLAEFCTGASAVCPSDAFEPNTTECRPSAGDCDVAEFCTGASVACPSDVFEPDTTECRPSAGDCDVAEYCAGTSAACPSDAFEPDTTECRPSAGDCDLAEYCTGVSAACPIDVFELSGTPCPDALYCNGIETCDGFGLCQDAGYPCQGDEWCNETGDQCVLHGSGDFAPFGDVDLIDFANFQTCFEQSATQSECEPANLTGEDDIIDLADFAEFLSVLSGPA